MKISRCCPFVPAITAGLLCLLMAAPVAAHPGSLWGIDLTSVLTMRDQARVVAHHHHKEHSDQLDDQVADLNQIRTVVIDPGHGGTNIGAVGIAGIPEKRLTLELAYQLREELQQKYPRLRVVLTRYWDTTVELEDRAEIANLANADLFLSLHYNAASHQRAVGFETFFLNANQALSSFEEEEEFAGEIEGVAHRGHTLELIQFDLLRAHRHELSAELAELIQHRFVRRIDSVDRGVKQGNFSVLRNAEMPAVVVEAGFMTHPEEGLEILTREHRSRITTSLIEAIEDFDVVLDEQLHDSEPADEEEAPVADGISLR